MAIALGSSLAVLVVAAPGATDSLLPLPTTSYPSKTTGEPTTTYTYPSKTTTEPYQSPSGTTTEPTATEPTRYDPPPSSGPETFDPDSPEPDERLGESSEPAPPPTLAESFNVEPAAGRVYVKPAGSDEFAVLAGEARVPVGSTVDATRGQVNLASARDAAGNLQVSRFYGGAFIVTQAAGLLPVTQLYLVGGDFSRCGRGDGKRSGKGKRSGARAATRRHRRAGRPRGAARGAIQARAARARTTRRTRPRRAGAARRPLRRLWGDGIGNFRTVGRFSSTTVRGTKWLTEDRCQGTRTRVARGKVEVLDFARRRTALLRAGQSYLARSPASALLP